MIHEIDTFVAQLEGPWQVGQIVSWGGKPHRVGRCPEGGERCVACDRIGYHVEKIETENKTGGAT